MYTDDILKVPKFIHEGLPSISKIKLVSDLEAICYDGSMRRKKLKQTLQDIHIKLLVIVVGVLFAAGVYYWYSASQNIQQNSPLPDNENILTVRGKVTMIRNSCGARFLDPTEAGDRMQYSICDAGTGVRIKDEKGSEVYISTSVGGPGSPYSGHRHDINPGDIITVHYVIDEKYGKSLYCSQCAIKTE